MANQNQYTHSSEPWILMDSRKFSLILPLHFLEEDFFGGEVNYSFGELSCNHHEVAEIYKKPF